MNPSCKPHDVSVLKCPKFLAMFSKRLKASANLDLLSYLEATPFEDTVPRQPITISVPLNQGQYTAMVTVEISPPQITKYSFTVQPEKKFTGCSHPSDVLSFPQLMLSPSDLAKSTLSCRGGEW